MHYPHAGPGILTRFPFDRRREPWEELSFLLDIVRLYRGIGLTGDTVGAQCQEEKTTLPRAPAAVVKFAYVAMHYPHAGPGALGRVVFSS